MFVSVLSLAACSDANQPANKVDTAGITTFRIESSSVWTAERTAFVLRKDGSGFYERYSVWDDAGNSQHKVEKSIAFSAGSIDFDQLIAEIGGLTEYFGDDVAQRDIARFDRSVLSLKTIPCGARATDNDGYVIYWNLTSSAEIDERTDLSEIFTIDGGCRSKEAVVVINRIKKAVSAFDTVVPASERNP